ncbi:MAG: glycoside hydrolase family 43 protein [Treponema sp.]|nr:glycoside hydrolase family 43 protein [Treponema sp.]
MKKALGTFVCAVSALSALSLTVASCSKNKGPALREPLPTDVFEKTLKRDRLTDEVSEYTPVKQDAAGQNFISQKYERTSHATWKCHDPKLFQDPVSGKYYVYSTGWTDGVQIRSSTDGIHWAKHRQSALWNPKDVSLKYKHMEWDDDFLQWVGYTVNDGTAYSTKWYSANKHPNSWAPTVVYQDGKYYMFHGIITDCLSLSNGTVHPAACITLAIADKPEGPFIPASRYDSGTYKNSSLVRYVWTTEETQNTQIGYEYCTNSAGGDWEHGFGTIDPEFVFDIVTGKLKEYKIGKNTCYALTYGSWKGGIALVYVDSKTFKPVNQKTGEVMDAPLDSIDGNFGIRIAGGMGAAYEGAQLMYNSDTEYYYLFVSMGDLSIQYRVGVGRSKKIEGPYLDTGGISMSFDTTASASGYHAVGGKMIGAFQFGDGYGFSSPGGQSILRDKDGRILFACHSRTTFLPSSEFTLQIRQMYFNKDGWPVLNMNEYYGESLQPEKHAMSDIAGDYEVIVTRRSRVPRIDGKASASEIMHIDESGTVSGAYTGHVALSDDGYSVIFAFPEEGIFSGFILSSTDWTLKDVPDSNRKTISFTALNSSSGSKKGEYFFGNRLQ